MKRSKFGLAFLLGAMLALFAGSAAFGQSDPYGTTSTTAGSIPSVTVVRGQSVDVKGSGCAAGAAVKVTFDDGTVLGNFTADANGDFVASVTIPATATVGEHLITATCGSVQQFLRVNVLGESVSTLARTGTSTTGPLVGIGAAAIVLGAAFVYGARRPRHA